MQRTKFCVVLALLLASGAACAREPMAQQILGWLGKSAAGLRLSRVTPITLKSGERAYLASASNLSAGGSAWAGYVLARPQLRQAITLPTTDTGNLGGQYSQIKVIGEFPHGTVLILGGSSGSQGVFDDTRSIVVFDGWHPQFIYTARMHSNLGACGQGMGQCAGNSVFLNPLQPVAHGLAVVATDVTYTGGDPDHLSYRFTSKLLTLPSE